MAIASIIVKSICLPYSPLIKVHSCNAIVLECMIYPSIYELAFEEVKIKNAANLLRGSQKMLILDRKCGT